MLLRVLTGIWLILNLQKVHFSFVPSVFFVKKIFSPTNETFVFIKKVQKISCFSTLRFCTMLVLNTVIQHIIFFLFFAEKVSKISQQHRAKVLFGISFYHCSKTFEKVSFFHGAIISLKNSNLPNTEQLQRSKFFESWTFSPVIKVLQKISAHKREV